jgi:type VII secretion effector (TIGR04197 family)
MIRSNLETTEQIATKMGNASDSIQRAANKKITKAQQTTLAVNGKAQEANEEAIKLARLFNGAFQQTIRNIHSAAKEFERTDQELQNKFEQLPLFKDYL